MKMPGQTGSENRRRQIVRSTRWDEQEFAQLQAIATYSGCSEAEVLRRLVRRANKQIVISRELVRAVGQLGNNVNQIARRMNSNEQVRSDQLLEAYRDLLHAVKIAKS
jgi:metal-sulfur cluster biosynthetic enzyme